LRYDWRKQGRLDREESLEMFSRGHQHTIYPAYHRALNEQVSLTIEDFYAPLNICFEMNIHSIKMDFVFFEKTYLLTVWVFTTLPVLKSTGYLRFSTAILLIL
jgi:hypothetical protein